MLAHATHPFSHDFSVYLDSVRRGAATAHIHKYIIDIQCVNISNPNHLHEHVVVGTNRIIEAVEAEFVVTYTFHIERRMWRHFAPTEFLSLEILARKHAHRQSSSSSFIALTLGRVFETTLTLLLTFDILEILDNLVANLLVDLPLTVFFLITIFTGSGLFSFF